jgi:carbon storage regulator
MLVLARRVGEEIVIGGDIRVTVLEVRGNQVRLGIVAPQDVRVLREELTHRPSQLADAPLARVLSEARQMSRSDSGIMAGLVDIAR